jgi:hypothetical protein
MTLSRFANPSLGIQKNGLSAFCGTESSPAADFAILSEYYGQRQINMQFLWWVYQDQSYTDLGGSNPNNLSYVSIITECLQNALTWQTPSYLNGVPGVIEVYQIDCENLRTPINRYCNP